MLIFSYFSQDDIYIPFENNLPSFLYETLFILVYDKNDVS